MGSHALGLPSVRANHPDVVLSFCIGVKGNSSAVGRPAWGCNPRPAERSQLQGIRTIAITYPDFMAPRAVRHEGNFLTVGRELKHPIELHPDKAVSPASVGKAYLKAMGIIPPLKIRHPTLPDEEPDYWLLSRDRTCASSAIGSAAPCPRQVYAFTWLPPSFAVGTPET